MGKARLIVNGLIVGALACSTDITQPQRAESPGVRATHLSGQDALTATAPVWGGSAEGTGTTNPTEVSFTIPGGTRGLVVWITQPIVKTDIITGVRVEGVALKRVASYVNQSTSGGRVYGYFLGANVPSGAATVAVSRSQTTTRVHIVAEAITGDADMAVIDFAGQAGFISSPRLTLQSGGRSSLGLTAMYSSIDNVLGLASEASGQQRVQDHDFGTETSLASRRSSVTTGDVSMGWNMNSGQIAQMAILVGVANAPAPSDSVPTDTLPPDSTPTDTLPPEPVDSGETLIGAGDVHARCTSTHASAKTAALIAREPKSARVFTVGDNAGVDGSAAEFQCFHGKWGGFKSRMHLAIGNHERRVDPTAKAYYDYGNGVGVDSGAVGRRGKGYYGVTYGGWRILILNSEQNISEQASWIQKDLSSHSNLCQLAIWHKPLFNSGTSVTAVSAVRPLWQALYAEGADVIVNAHDHSYQRNAKARPDGVRDPDGIRQFIAGTGGGVLGGISTTPLAINEKALSAHGVLKLKLYAKHYDWEFIDVAGAVRDSGTDQCH
ncbi:MAG: metallophosphoesterase family protein [Gemmatimonadales bacterium]